MPVLFVVDIKMTPAQSGACQCDDRQRCDRNREQEQRVVGQIIHGQAHSLPPPYSGRNVDTKTKISVRLPGALEPPEPIRRILKQQSPSNVRPTSELSRPEEAQPVPASSGLRVTGYLSG